MMAPAFLDTNLPPVGKFHFLRVGAWVYVFSIGEPAKDMVARVSGILQRCSAAFNSLSPENKAVLASGLLTMAAKLTAFDDLRQQDVKEKKAQRALQLGPRMTLESLGERWGDNAVRLISGVAKHRGITLKRASAQIRKYQEMTRLIVAINESAPKKSRSKSQIRSLRQDAETAMLRALLVEAGVRIIESGNDSYGHDPRLVLMGILTVWTSGKKTKPDTMRKRLAALRKRGYGEDSSDR
jgi:hypothetical protein